MKDLERSERNWDGSVNWDAIPHQQLWDWFSQPRLEGMRGWAEAFTNKVAGHFQAAADEVNQALRTAGVHWEGQAAESMQEASTPLAEHALVAKDAATSVGDTTLQQLMHAGQLARAIPEPKPAPDQANLMDMMPGHLPRYLDDVREQEAAVREAEERARDLGRSADTNADDAVSQLPRFEAAPTATVDKAEPASTDSIDSESVERRDGDGGRGAGPGPGGPGPSSSEPYPTTGGPAPGDSVAPRPVDPSSGGGTSGQSWTPPGGNQPIGTPGPGGPGTPADSPRTATPITGPVPGGPGGSSGGGPRGSGGGPGGGRGAGPAPGAGAGVRGAGPGEGPVGRGGTPGTAGRGPGGMGMAPMGAGRGKGDDDTERTSPEYLRAHNDEFWDGTPAVAPPVIGEEDDDE